MAKSGMAGSGMADRDAGRVRLVGLGTGQMGGGMGRLVLRRSGLTLVGAHARRAERAGQELGSVIGLGTPLGLSIDGDLPARLDGKGLLR